MHGDKSTWIQTFTGREFWPLDPRVEDIDIVDIAHALSLVCRYTGHCRHHYSVAQHCVLGAEVLMMDWDDDRLALTFLLHDASEAYIADIARPIKSSFGGYAEVEAKLEACIAEKFGLPNPFPPVIKEVDTRMFVTECRDLMAEPPRMWGSGFDPYPFFIARVDPEEAEADFLGLFYLLTD